MRNRFASEVHQRSRGAEAVDHARGVCAMEDTSVHRARRAIAVCGAGDRDRPDVGGVLRMRLRQAEGLKRPVIQPMALT